MRREVNRLARCSRGKKTRSQAGALTHLTTASQLSPQGSVGWLGGQQDRTGRERERENACLDLKVVVIRQTGWREGGRVVTQVPAGSQQLLTSNTTLLLLIKTAQTRERRERDKQIKKINLSQLSDSIS